MYGAGRQPTKQAIARAERLLRRFLSPQQVIDWEKFQSIEVRGSREGVFRLTLSFSPRHAAVVRMRDRLGISVWPRNLYIAADWTLAMMFYLQADEMAVVRNGCHESVVDGRWLLRP